jgi:hypothetical protein
VDLYGRVKPPLINPTYRGDLLLSLEGVECGYKTQLAIVLFQFERQTDTRIANNTAIKVWRQDKSCHDVYEPLYKGPNT